MAFDDPRTDLHQIVKSEVPLVLPDQPKGLGCFAFRGVLLSLKGREELGKASRGCPHQPLIHPHFCLAKLFGLWTPDGNIIGALRVLYCPQFLLSANQQHMFVFLVLESVTVSFGCCRH